MTLRLAENVGAKAGTYGRDALYALAGKIFWMDMNRVAFDREFADSHYKRYRRNLRGKSKSAPMARRQLTTASSSDALTINELHPLQSYAGAVTTNLPVVWRCRRT